MEIDNYGRVFKILRKQRGFKLSSFQDIGISPATVSNFENGKTKISFDKLYTMLCALSVTIDEYFKYTNDINISESCRYKKLIHNITQVILTKNNDKLFEYETEAIQLQEYYLYLAIKGIQTPLKLDEIGLLSGYLDNIKYWREIDLYTLYLCINYLKPRQSAYLLEGFFIEEGQYYYSSNITFFHLSCHIISSLILSNNKK